MVSEDSDQLRSGFSPVHRLCDLSDLDQPRRHEMSPACRELNTHRELLEVALFRSPQGMLPEERNDLLEEILAALNDELSHVFAMIVVALVDEDPPTAEEPLELFEHMDTTHALRHDESMRDLVAGSVAFPPRTVCLPHETDREASFSVYKTDHPATKLDQPFLLIFRITRHLVTIAVASDSNE